jgi:hypothetical protein
MSLEKWSASGNSVYYQKNTLEKPSHLTNVLRHKQGKYTTMQGKQAEQEVVG